MKLTDLQESSLSRIHGAMQKYACGVITAYRSCKDFGKDDAGKTVCLVTFTHAENQARNKNLLAKLQNKRFGVTGIMGSYIENFEQPNATEVQEHSYFVVNHSVEGDDDGVLEKYLRSLGEYFDQDSIINIAFGQSPMLIGTNQTGYPGFGNVVTLGGFKGGYAAEFMSRVNNRSFVFKEHYLPMERAGRYGCSVIAERDWWELVAKTA